MTEQTPDRRDKDATRMERQFARLERSIPKPLARSLHWLRQPAVRLVRIPLGILLVLGGIFSILPVLGIWMLPLGLLLLAIDVVPLRRPVSRFLIWASRRWTLWRRGKPR